MSSTLYVFYFTFWMKTGEVIHNRTQTQLHNHHISKPVSSISQCQRIANGILLRYKDVCKPGNPCEKVEITCKKSTNSEFFSKSSPHRQFHSPPERSSSKDRSSSHSKKKSKKKNHKR